MYTYDEAFTDSIKYFNGDELAAKVFIDKYALRDYDNNILENTPDMMHHRLAKEFARIEQKKFKKPYSEKYIYELLKNYEKILPQGSPIFGIGNPYQICSISNCFVLEEPEDSYSGIIRVDEQLVNISKRRGGVGISLNKLRPKNFKTTNAARTSTGILSWMHRYSNSIREVCQNGRRGALMLTLNVHHPDIENFITAKNDGTSVTGANISVQITDEFFSAVLNNEDYEQRFPLKNPTFTRKVSARKIWKLIIHNAWLRAEPGIQFIDSVLRESPADCYALFGFLTITSNPCSELFLSILDSCRLLAINLMCCVKNAFSKDSYFDYTELYELAQVGQRLMDDLVDLELECIGRIIAKIKSDPEPDHIKKNEIEMWEKIHKSCYNGRRTGLGITALGDVLAALGIEYGSEESVNVTEEIYKTLKFGSYRSSIDMAKELGPFPVWDWNLEKDNPFINRFKDESILSENPIDGNPDIHGLEILKDIKKYGRRNIANLTTAPVGTLSTQARFKVEKLYTGTTSGFEPCFKKSFIRRKKGNPGDDHFRSDFIDETGDHWMEFEVNQAGVQAWLDINPDAKMKDCPYVEADNVVWTQKVKMQGAAQKHVDHSISVTCNVPENTKEEEIAKIYEAAWQYGCKGYTVYRDKCRSGVLVEKAIERPKDLTCDVHHVSVKGKEYFVLCGMNNGVLYEIFAGRNGWLDHSVKTGKITKYKKAYKAIFEDETELCPITAMSEDDEQVITRLVSLAIRNKTPLAEIIDQLEKIKGGINSFNKAICRVLKKYLKSGTIAGEKCPDCSSSLIYVEGCKRCSNENGVCTYSKCG